MTRKNKKQTKIPADAKSKPSGKRRITAKRVYELTSQIPKGRVSTYGAIAGALSSWGGSRAVGQILKRNPTPIVVPCHRVVRSDGSVGGYGGAEGFAKKIKLLKSEGIEVREDVIPNLKEFLF